MRNCVKIIIACFLTLSTLASCYNPQNGENTGEVLQLSYSNIDMYVGDVCYLSATSSLDANPKVEWTTANSDIATIDENGVVTAVALGTTTITAKTEGGAKKYCVVNVVTREPGFEELINLTVAGLPQTIKHYNKYNGELITEYVIESYSLRTVKQEIGYVIYITLHGRKIYDFEGADATSPMFIATKLYMENGEFTDIENYKKDISTKVGEEFQIELDAFRALTNTGAKRELELRIDSIVEE